MHALPLTQENAVDLHCVGRVPLTLAMTVGGKTCRYCRKRESLSLLVHFSNGRHMLGASFCNETARKFMSACNHTEHYRK